jgi:hypothetical protein
MGLFAKRSPDAINEYVFAIRGTTNKKDLGTDVKIFCGYCPDRVQKSFQALLNVAQVVPSGSKIEVVGHSLGGYLAALVVAGVHMRTHKKTSPFKQFIETPESSEVFRTVVGRLGRREITINCHAYNPAVGARLGKSKHVWKNMTGFRFLPKDVIPVRRDEPRYYFYRVERDIFSLRLKKVLSGQPTNYRLKHKVSS